MDAAGSYRDYVSVDNTQQGLDFLRRMFVTRVTFLGAPVDSISMDDAISQLEGFIRSKVPHLVIAFNVPKLWRMERDARLKNIVERAELVLPEHVVALSSRLCAVPLKASIGNDRLTQAFLPIAAQKGYRVFFLGTRRETLDRLQTRVLQCYPNLKIAGSHDGFFSDHEAGNVAAKIREAKPDVLFVGMGTPKQEYWMDTHGRKLGVPVVMGVGGTLDLLAGLKGDPPSWISAAGVEWIYRAIEDPRGKAKRYLTALPWFISALLLKGVLSRRSTSTVGRISP